MKAKLTGIGTHGLYDLLESNGSPRDNMGCVGVEFKIGKREYSSFIPFPLDLVRERFDENGNKKAELLTDRLMQRIKKYVKDADMTDVENVLRLKMPYLLHAAIDYKLVYQRF